MNRSETAKQRDSETGAEKAKVRTFRDLIAWQRGMELAQAIYSTISCLPDTERFGLTAQLRRAAVSIPSNIAEGHARQSRLDYLKFLRTGRGSVAEVSTQVELCERLGFLQINVQLRDLINEEARILQALIRALEAKEANKVNVTFFASPVSPPVSLSRCFAVSLFPGVLP